jgi:hypothetical protein
VSAPAILPAGDTARARKTDPVTSHEAADSISVVGREASEVEVLTILRAADKPITSEQLEHRHITRAWQIPGISLYSGARLRTALKQLADDGMVIRDGEGRTKSGRRAATWRAAA